VIIDQWNPSRRRYRTETFCYGPLSCRFYQAGPARTVPAAAPGMNYTEEDWVDDEASQCVVLRHHLNNFAEHNFKRALAKELIASGDLGEPT
jgi:hypothetical protein